MNMINLAATPRLPYDDAPYDIVSHDTSLPELEWDPKGVNLYRCSTQRSDGGSVADIYKEIMCDKIPVLNANVLDWLLEHPEHIPTKWQRRTRSHILFWGTLYRFQERRVPDLTVRSLYCTGPDKYSSGIISVIPYINGRHTPAAIFKR